MVYDLAGNGRSQILGTAGAVKLVTGDEGRVLGVHLVGDRVGELIGEAQILVNTGARVEEVARFVHAHPTQGEALGERYWSRRASRCTRTPSRRPHSPRARLPSDSLASCDDDCALGGSVETRCRSAAPPRCRSAAPPRCRSAAPQRWPGRMQLLADLVGSIGAALAFVAHDEAAGRGDADAGGDSDELHQLLTRKSHTSA